MIDERTIHDMVNLVRMEFEDWDSFKNPKFVEEERDYKLNAIGLFNELLSKDKFEELIARGEYKQIIDSLKKVGQKTNLLYLGTPRTGDLAIFSPPKIPKEICEAFFDLLYGEGNSPDRLQRYVDFCDSNNLNCKWTAATYFLFLAHPEADYFVKPSIATWLLDFTGSDFKYESIPSKEIYQELLNICNDIKERLSDYKPLNMVDIQGFIFVAYNQQKEIIGWYKKGNYQSRREQIETFTPFAREMIKATLENGPLTNEKLTAFIQLLKYVDHKNTVSMRSYFDCLEISEDYWQRWIDAPAGYTAAAKAAIQKPNRKQLQAVFELLEGTFKIQDHDELINLIERYVKQKVPEVTAGIFSPWLQYLRPDFFPILNGGSKPGFKKLGLKRNTYTEAIDIAQTVSRVIGEKDLGILDAMFWDTPSNEEPKSAENGEEIELSSPFSEIFENIEQANWSFDLFKGTLNRLGVKDINDERVALTCVYKDSIIRLNFCQWAILSFGETIILIQNKKFSDIAKKTWEPFKVPSSSPELYLTEFDYETFDENKAEIFGSFNSALEFVAEYFSNWSGTPFHPHHRPELAKAVFDLEYREKLFKEGLIVNSPFSEKTFELLEGIHENPTYDFYNENKKKFENNIQIPFQSLFQKVVDKLPKEILDIMEHEKRVFSIFPKNDYGRGGAWDFYWGALYPKGSKRSEDVQLSAWLNYSLLSYGFTLGNYAKETNRRFIDNVKTNKEFLCKSYQPMLIKRDFGYGERQDVFPTTPTIGNTHPETDFSKWLDRITELGSSVHRILTKGEILNMSEEEIAAEITETFKVLFPFVLLATEDNPIPLIEEYVKKYLGAAEPPTPTKITWGEIKSKLEYNLTNKLDLSDCNLHFPDDMRQALESRISKAIENGKHIMLIGPPGTGKSKLAKHICQFYTESNKNFNFSTATSDWSTFETIGGYRPSKTDSSLEFRPGIFLNSFRDEKTKDPINKWLIIDEINRADIDKAFGSLFSALTGDSVILPYEMDDKAIEVIGDTEHLDEDSPLEDNHFVIHPDWRIIATMNTYDKSSLYEMSYAFMRRFAFVPVEIPHNINEELIRSYIEKWDPEYDDEEVIGNLVEIWKVINETRPIGPAIMEDIFKFVKDSEEHDFASAIIMYVMPQFEGQMDEKIVDFVKDMENKKIVDSVALKEFCADFFQIDRGKFDPKTKGAN